MRTAIAIVAFALLIFLANRWHYYLDWVETEYAVNPQTNWLAPKGTVGACVPPFATDLQLAADVGTNEYFVAFRFPAERAAEIPPIPRGAAGVSTRPLSAYASKPLGAYARSFANTRSWWDVDLVESALAGTGPAVRSCEAWNAYVVLDEENGRGFAWMTWPFDL